MLQKERLKMDKETRKTLVSISLSLQTLDQIDTMRGDAPRSAYLRKVIEQFASNSKTSNKAV